MSKKQGDYTVGFGRPPLETRFKPGKSGNPKGRPKQSLTIDDLYEREFEKTVMVQTDRGPKRIRKADLLVQQQMNLALKGNPKLLKDLIEILDRVRQKATKAHARASVTQYTSEQIDAMTEPERIELYQQAIRQSRG